jgi:hypothetical protein
MRQKNIKTLFGTSVKTGSGLGSPPNSECLLDGYKRKRGGYKLSPQIKCITELMLKNMSFQVYLLKRILQKFKIEQFLKLILSSLVAYFSLLFTAQAGFV